MSKFLDPINKGPVCTGELVGVLGELQSDGCPDALHLAEVMGSVPIGATVSEEVCSVLTRAVFNWQANSA
jgi:hypothetical protein